MMHETTLPRDVSRLTTEWLNGVFARSQYRAHVVRSEQTRIIWGTATKVFLSVDYSGPDADKLPAQLCVKGGFDEESRALGLGPAYELEAWFFREIAPELDIPLPRCLSAEVGPGQGILVFEDLNARGVTFPDVVDGLLPDEVAKALEVMARWHAATWDTRAPRADWLPVGCRSARGALDVLLQREMFVALTSRDIVPGLPAGLRDAVSVKAAYQALWQHDDASTLALSHGDAHVGQTYRDPAGEFAFLDWQAVCLAPWSSDVAYFVCGALEPDQRRATERALLDHYRGALAAAGGPRLDADEAWHAYRQHTLHGFVWALTPTHVQSEAVVAELSRRYLIAIEDHGPMQLLEL